MVSSVSQAERIAVVVDGDVAVITISDPDSCNALTLRMWRELQVAVVDLDADPRVKAIVLRGEGADFSSGANIKELPDDPAAFHEVHLATERAIARVTKPVIAAIRGHCVGGGCEIAVAADLRFADPSAVFGITASRLGIVYPAAPTRRLVDLVGLGAARRMLYGGELFDARWAERVGLVTEIVSGDVDACAVEYARLLATRAQSTIRAAKVLTDTDRAEPTAVPCDLRRDYVEGLRAFRERREPFFPSSMGPVD
ncbi:hypothetical protein ACG83_08730 [Frankia sp. R43]|uniref:enoyl-CoA hydratase/isomerase family protein n=1 Tax=Frankia sp. R43 TaxID=269536 RepID=UPI0006CA391B|nr:enoyl-CoA hydratase/isomerase family protein [Frankia sp. R43]KPM55431.1 hypothetical protein ACG83_08730 [Frankia sp. R43]